MISSLLILLPAVFGLVFENSFAGQGSAQNGLQGRGGSVFALFGVPLSLLAAHWLCIFLTATDPKNKDQTAKAMNLVYWLAPAASLFSGSILFSSIFGHGLDIGKLPLPLTGFLSVAVGNYLPKCRPNNTIGIKTPWAVSNDENWHMTHRISGYIWVACGFLMLICSFLPAESSPLLLVILLTSMAVLPVLYSYLYHRKQQKRDGASMFIAPQTKRQGKSALISLSVVLATIVLIAALSFTGSIEINCTEDTLDIHSSYWRGLTIPYGNISSVEYRTDLSGGIRTNGFGSARLSLGAFKNDELGNYTRYTYTRCDSCIVLDVNGSMLVINGWDDSATRALYDELLKKLG